MSIKNQSFSTSTLSCSGSYMFDVNTLVGVQPMTSSSPTVSYTMNYAIGQIIEPNYNFSELWHMFCEKRKEEKHITVLLDREKKWVAEITGSSNIQTGGQLSSILFPLILNQFSNAYPVLPEPETFAGLWKKFLKKRKENENNRNT